jgi:hypothetical protein
MVFDSNEDHTEGILKDEHLLALQQFWQYTRNNPRKSSPISSRVAYVLPNGFGYGFRGPDDKIWGLWQADALTQNISVSVGSLLKQYVEHYVLASTTGVATDQNGILKVSMASTVNGNYRPVFKIGASLTTVI